MIVTGIGTRNPPITQELSDIMLIFCNWASERGYTLRSGGAIGMDSWFERLWYGPKEIFIPSATFSPDGGSTWRCHGVSSAIYVEHSYTNARAVKIAREIHPAWNAMSRRGKELHTRNVYQVLGEYLDNPSDIIIYYAKMDNECKSVVGGTRTAVELARRNNILEFNLMLPDDITRLFDYMRVQ